MLQSIIRADVDHDICRHKELMYGMIVRKNHIKYSIFRFCNYYLYEERNRRSENV